MDDSANELYFFSGVATPETAMGIATYLPRGCLTMFTLRDAIIPLSGVRILHPAQYDILGNHPGDRQKAKNGTLVV